MMRKTQDFKNRMNQARSFVADGVWDVELSSLSVVRRLGVRIVRVIHLVVNGFQEDQCPLHASSLTFSTLMSFVPVIAVSLALARGFGAGDGLEQQVRSFVWQRLGATGISTNAAGAGTVLAEAGSATGTVVTAVSAAGGVYDEDITERINQMISFVFDSVDNISFAKLGGIGLAILIWSVIQVLGRVEFSFNKVWGVASGRPIHRKLFDYLSVLIVLPILAIAASSLPAVSVVTRYLDKSSADMVEQAIGSGRLEAVAVICMTTLLFTFMIMFMPNTRVKTHAGLAGGLATALLFIGWMKLCIAVQVGVVKYSKIYGSFAVVPIVLFWVFVSWEIILLGAEIAYAIQNCSTYQMEMQARSASARSKFLLGLSVVREAARAIIGTGPVFESAAFAREKRVPVRLLNEVIRELEAGGLLAELAGRPGCFVLMKSPDSVAVKDVFDVVMKSGTESMDLGAHLGKSVTDVLNRTEAGLAQTLDKLDARSLANMP